MGKEKGLVNPAVKDRCTATGFISEVHLYPYLHGEKVDRPFGGFFKKKEGWGGGGYINAQGETMDKTMLTLFPIELASKLPSWYNIYPSRKNKKKE